MFFSRSVSLVRAGAFSIVCAALLCAPASSQSKRLEVTQGTGSNGAIDFLQGSGTGSALQGNVGSADTGITTPFGVFGVYDSSGAFGIGVAGVSTTGYAVGAEGLGSQPSLLAYPGGTGSGVEAVAPGASSTAPAIYAVGKNDGDAVEGVTTGGSAVASVVGLNTSNEGIQDGVYGQTEGGRAGVEGWTFGGGFGGVIGISASSPAGMYAENYYAASTGGITDYPGLYATSAVGAALFAETTKGEAGAYVENDGNYDGTYYGLSVETDGSEGIGVSTSGNSVGFQTATSAQNIYPYEGIVSTARQYGVLGVTTGGSTTYPLYLASSAGEVAYVDGSGALYLHNGVHTFARTRDGYGVESFTPRSAAPTVEDVGEGHLAGGSAVVRIDRAMTESLDRSAAYHVFLTPEGDTNGLYVVQKTPQYFVVRETRGGRGTFAFDYRIVGAVDGQASARMVLTSKSRMEEGQPAILAHRQPQTARKRTAEAANAIARRGTVRAYAAPPVRPLVKP